MVDDFRPLFRIFPSSVSPNDLTPRVTDVLEDFLSTVDSVTEDGVVDEISCEISEASIVRSAPFL
jgi:hypothetical protein